MSRWLKWVLGIGVGLLVVAAGAYWWLLLQSGTPDRNFIIDMSEVRRLAASLPGPRASAIRVEQVGAMQIPRIVIMAGDGWETEAMQVFAYQLVFPGRTIVIDTGFDKSAADGLNASAFDQAAFDRVSAALGKAIFIAVTHEHPDHLGGLVAQPDLRHLLEHAFLTKEQVENPDAAFPPGLRESILRIGYERYDALAPGVVLIKAPGHTPGSQMVYVALDNGTELLLIGDVAWKMRNVENIRQRARLASIIGGEDSGAVLSQLAAIHDLMAAEPELHIVPGHDGAVVQALIGAGILTDEFE